MSAVIGREVQRRTNGNQALWVTSFGTWIDIFNQSRNFQDAAILP